MKSHLHLLFFVILIIARVDAALVTRGGIEHSSSCSFAEGDDFVGVVGFHSQAQCALFSSAVKIVSGPTSKVKAYPDCERLVWCFSGHSSDKAWQIQAPRLSPGASEATQIFTLLSISGIDGGLAPLSFRLAVQNGVQGCGDALCTLMVYDKTVAKCGTCQVSGRLTMIGVGAFRTTGQNGIGFLALAPIFS